MSKKCVYGQPHEHAKAGKSMPDNVEIALDSQGPMQITDVQGCLKESLPFWKDVLHASYHILECIESGYHLSLKFIPLFTPSIIITWWSPTRTSNRK